jgi:hypothetical protein
LLLINPIIATRPASTSSGYETKAASDRSQQERTADSLRSLGENGDS